MKCDSCIHQIEVPPSQDMPHGEFFCEKGHWEGDDFYEEKDKDPWESCEDYDPNI